MTNLPKYMESIAIIGIKITAADIADHCVNNLYNFLKNNKSIAIGIPSKAANGHPKIQF